MKKKIVKTFLISIIVLTMFANTPVVNAAFTSLLPAIKDTIQHGRGTNLKSKSGVHKGGNLPISYSGYGFGTLTSSSTVRYSGATGGTNPNKTYWKNKIGSGDSAYQDMYSTGRVVTSAPSNNENHNYAACYTKAGKYDGTLIDVKAELLDYTAQDSKAVVSFGKKISVGVLGVHWVKVKWSFHVSNGSCTVSAITVKGNTTYWDVDNQQGIMLWDSTNEGI